MQWGGLLKPDLNPNYSKTPHQLSIHQCTQLPRVGVGESHATPIIDKQFQAVPSRGLRTGKSLPEAYFISNVSYF